MLFIGLAVLVFYFFVFFKTSSTIEYVELVKFTETEIDAETLIEKAKAYFANMRPKAGCTWRLVGQPVTKTDYGDGLACYTVELMMLVGRQTLASGQS